MPCMHFIYALFWYKYVLEQGILTFFVPWTPLPIGEGHNPFSEYYI
jgi:hypothetical protein